MVNDTIIIGKNKLLNQNIYCLKTAASLQGIITDFPEPYMFLNYHSLPKTKFTDPVNDLETWDNLNEEDIVYMNGVRLTSPLRTYYDLIIYQNSSPQAKVEATEVIYDNYTEEGVNEYFKKHGKLKELEEFLYNTLGLDRNKSIKLEIDDFIYGWIKRR